MGFRVATIPKLTFAHSELSGVGTDDHHAPTVDTNSVESLLVGHVSGSRTAAAGAGTQDITGFGFDPVGAIVLAASSSGGNNAISVGGIDDDGLEGAVASDLAAATGATDGLAVRLRDGAAQQDAVGALITDGIRLTWSQGGGGLDCTFRVIAFGISSVVS